MANWNDPQPTRTGFGASPSLNGEVLGKAGAYDQGLRRHMLSIYNYMASGVLLSGVVALLFARSGMAAQVMATPLAWVIMLAPLGFVFGMSLGANRMKTSTLQMLFWGFCVVMGLSLSTIFLVFTGASIATTFFATAGAFAGLTAWDTQRLKGMYYQVAGTDFAGKAIVLGALTLYLDFINMFQFLLSFLGNRN